MIEKERFEIKDFPLIKIKSKEIIEKTINGSFYMNSLAYYRKLYEDKNDEVVGDPYEGMLFIHEADMYIPEKNVYEQIRDSAIKTVYVNNYVYCLFGLNPNIHKSFCFTEEQKEHLTEFDDTAMIITDPYEYFNRIKKAAVANNYDIHGDFVIYYDEKIDDCNRFLSATGQSGKEIVFYKRNRYSYQNEYRFTINNKSGVDHIELDIGNISDITRVISTKELLSSRIEKRAD